MRRPARPALAAVLALALGAVAAGYGLYLLTTHEVAVDGGVLQEGVIVDGPFSLLPAFATTPNARDVSSLLFRGLTRPGPDGQPQPDLAATWQPDADAKTFTFHLRPGQRWSDGSAVTSQDAIYTLAVLQGDQLRGSETGDAWQGITATAPDAQTVVYTLPSASAAFPTLAGIGLLPSHKLANRPAAQLPDTTDAPTSGPFKVARLDRDVIHLVRNPHAAKRPYIDGIDIHLFTNDSDAMDALRAGRIDLLTGASMTDASSLRGSSIHAVAPLTFSYAQVLFNQKTAALSDQHVRLALAQALDRKAMIASVLSGFGRPAGSPIPPAITWASDKNPGPALDQRAAGRALDAAGWTRPRGGGTRTKSGQPLKLRLVAPDVAPYHAIAGGIAHDLAAVGVQVQSSYVAPEKMLTDVLQPHNFDMALQLIDNGPDPDIFVFWHSSEQQAGGFNFSGMPADAFLDKDLEDGRFKTDLNARRQAYLDAQRILRAAQPAAWLFSPEAPELVATRLRGFRLPPAAGPGQRYDYVADWYLVTRRVGNR